MVNDLPDDYKTRQVPPFCKRSQVANTNPNIKDSECFQGDIDRVCEWCGKNF